jgi:hypothetical protein
VDAALTHCRQQKLEPDYSHIVAGICCLRMMMAQ